MDYRLDRALLSAVYNSQCRIGFFGAISTMFFADRYRTLRKQCQGCDWIYISGFVRFFKSEIKSMFKLPQV